eukprot:TRINITY_DN45177_c0_g1_i1.p1 TRINITY_DN45177_c0_g1~~TRINITY_DN45177_c0_g1_i1.p1  ORF type:complete len:307 (+),score=38.86 TRINITY_DN45177_c0_g1_i1:83-1003(+)
MVTRQVSIDLEPEVQPPPTPSPEAQAYKLFVELCDDEYESAVSKKGPHRRRPRSAPRDTLQKAKRHYESCAADWLDYIGRKDLPLADLASFLPATGTSVGMGCEEETLLASMSPGPSLPMSRQCSPESDDGARISITSNMAKRVAAVLGTDGACRPCSAPGSMYRQVSSSTQQSSSMSPPLGCRRRSSQMGRPSSAPAGGSRYASDTRTMRVHTGAVLDNIFKKGTPGPGHYESAAVLLQDKLSKGVSCPRAAREPDNWLHKDDDIGPFRPPLAPAPRRAVIIMPCEAKPRQVGCYSFSRVSRGLS